MERRILSSIALLLFFVIGCAQISQPVHWNVTHRTEKDGRLAVKLQARIDKGFHIYGTDIPEGGPQATEFVIDESAGLSPDGKFVLHNVDGQRITVDDKTFGMTLSYYADSVTFTGLFNVTADDWRLKGHIYYMACNDESCLAPTRHEFDLSGKRPAASAKNAAKSVAKLASAVKTAPSDSAVAEKNRVAADSLLPKIEPSAENAVADAPLRDIYSPVIDEMRALGNGEAGASAESHGGWYIFLAGFLAGLIALVTPCVWPMIPMTVSFFLKRTKDRRRSIRDACIYGLSIVVIYVGLGLIVTALFGASALNSLATNAVFNIIFFLLLVLFGLSFLGAFELTLPASWTTRLDQKADAATGLLSIFFMAFTLSLVSFSCTGPIIGTLLVEAATSGSMLYPAIGMTGFALALALPFALFAMFPSMLKSMPKSGGWMNRVKVVLGFGELALSLKFLSVADLAYGWGLLDREVFLCLWIVIFLLLGLYLLGFIRLPHDADASPSERVSVGRLMSAAISLAFAIYMVPGLWGAPCKAISAFAPPLSTQDFRLGEASATTFHDYADGMAEARRLKRPVLLDFSGFGCVNCRKMEAAVLTDPQVKSLVDENFVFVELMVDDKAELAEPEIVEENGKHVTLRTVGDKWSYLQRNKFGANAQPFYVVLDADGMPLSGGYGYSEDIPLFVKYLNNALKLWKK